MGITLKEKYENTAAIAYYGLNAFEALEVLDIEYGIKDKLIACFNWGTGRKMIGKHTVETAADGRTFIRKCGEKYYLDEMIRLGL